MSKRSLFGRSRLANGSSGVTHYKWFTGPTDQMLQMMRGQVYNSRLPRYVTGFRIPHKTGDFMPFIGNDVGILESQSKHIVISVFTANHLGLETFWKMRSDESRN